MRIPIATVKGMREQLGVEQRAEFMIVGCDTFDYSDYPVYIKTVEAFDAALKEHQNPNKMSRVMEVYDLKLSKIRQLDERRAWNTPDRRASSASVKP